MHTLYILEKSDYEKWLSSLDYSEWEDPKGFGGVQYLRCRQACRTFDAQVTPVSCPTESKLSEVIQLATGQAPRIYQADEIDEVLEANMEYIKQVASYQVRPPWLSQIDPGAELADPGEELADPGAELADPLVALLANLRQCVQETPSVTISRLERRRSSRHLTEYSITQTVGETGILNHDVLITISHPLEQLVRKAIHAIHSMLPEPSYSMFMLRNAHDFFMYLTGIADVGIPTKPRENRWHRKPERPNVVLLYTNEDPHIASYVRTHMDALDKASGEYCDVLLVERPDSSASCSFWRRLLMDSHFVAWKLLGWADSLPYNRNEAYRIAGRLGISFDRLPCAAGIEAKSGRVEDVFPLSGDLPSSFRRIFSHYQKFPGLQNKREQLFSQSTSHRRKEVNPDTGKRCFLSYAHEDKDIVKQVAVNLHSYGLEVWFDEWNVMPGDRITEKIEDGLAGSTAVAVFLSPSSMESPWVKSELHHALHEAISTGTIKLIPVMLSPVTLPPLIRNYRYIDVEMEAHVIAAEIEKALNDGNSEMTS